MLGRIAPHQTAKTLKSALDQKRFVLGWADHVQTADSLAVQSHVLSERLAHSELDGGVCGKESNRVCVTLEVFRGEPANY